MIGGAYYLGSFLTTISVKLGHLEGSVSQSFSEMKGSVGEVKGSIDKLQAITYELNGTLKGHDEQIKAVQVAVREASAKTAAETTDKAAERITGVLKASEERTGKGNAALAGKFDAIERRAEEASDSLVVWLVLNPGDKPVARSDTTLTNHLPVPPQDKKVIIHGGQSRSKTIQAGVVTLYEGGELLKPPGVIAATARPMDDQGRVPIQLFFRDKTALEGFEKVMDRLRDERKPMRLKVTFALG